MIYFDHNATSPLLPQARQAWVEANKQYIGNPSSPHRLGQRADAALTAAREQLARVIGCDAQDLVWTSGATESSNLALHHFAQTLASDAEVWVSAIEHPCVRAPIRHYFSKRHRLIPVGHAGVVELGWLAAELRRRRAGLVAVMAANNETGVVQPWREALALCREHGVPFFCDAVQWVGKLPARGLGDCDFVSGTAHKFGGPKGVGFLKCPAKGRVAPLLLGGPQEDGRRAGTENVAGILSMMTALEVREHELAAAAAEDGGSTNENGASFHSSSSSVSPAAVRLRLAWREQFERGLLAALPGAGIVGASQPRLWNTVSAFMPVADCQQRWVVKLDKLGFAVSTGSACSSGREVPSQVLSAMGYAPAEAGRVLRFSSGWETPEADWDALLAAVKRVHRGESRRSAP